MQKQLTKTPGLLYGELKGDVSKGSNVTLTIWDGKAMRPFRDGGAHKFAMRFFSWVFFGGPTQVYFCTWQAKGRIPTADEAAAIAREYGRYFDGGVEKRKAHPPRQAWYEVLQGEKAGAD